ncbi:hypothetical protein ACP70R_020968 [Stipagrostis hirtigluma subsp. patula]
MAALLHQAALPAAKPHHPWALSSTPSLSPPPLSRRRRAPAPAIRSAATDGSIGTDGAPPSKKMTRKEKQHERRQQQDTQQRQRQLLMEASLPKQTAVAASGGRKENGDDDDELPQPVFDRILRRIMFAVGVPMASGVALLNLYETLRRDQGVPVPSWLSLLTILISFGTSAFGIAYGTLSASWDPEREGSLLGIEEARANWPVLWQEEIEKKAKKKKK